MAPAVVTYDEAKKTIGTLPSLAPRPNAVNLRALSTELEQKLETIPSQQSPEFGYTGMVMPPEIYALRTTTAWADWPDPGNHPATADNTVEQTNVRTLYDANKAVYDSQMNVKRAICDALNMAVPKEFRKPVGNQIGQKVFTVRDNPRQVLTDLRTKYGTCTPNEKSANEAAFSAPWNPRDPIEALFDRLEDCYVFSIMAKPPFTMEQLIDKAIMAIQRTGLYETALLEWTGFTPENKTWQQLKLHFEEAYEIRLAAGQGTAATHGYVNNATADDDDDSIATIQETIANIHMANNANYASITEHLQASRTETAALRAELAAAKQEMANLANATMRNTSVATTVPQFVQAPPVYMAPAPQMMQGYDRPYHGGGRGRGRGRGRGGNRYGRIAPPGYGNQFPAYAPPMMSPSGYGIPPPVIAAPPGFAQGIPPPSINMQQQNTQRPAYSNKTKYYNNWNMCFTCGWDVPGWHNSQTCNVQYTNPLHQVGCNRENAQSYMAAGHRVCKKGMHKTKLPENPGPNQA